MHEINKYFNDIFVISLPGSARHDLFLKHWEGLQFRQADFVFQDIDCMLEGLVIKHKFKNIPSPLHTNINGLIVGQVACSLAHMLIYDTIIKDQLHNTLILEDDSILLDITNVEESLKQNCDIMSLFCGQLNGSSLLGPLSDGEKFTNKWDKQGTSAYIVKTPEVAQFLLDKQLKNFDTADGVIMHSGLNVLAIWPPACFTNDSPSIIAHGLY
jgi:GR25 family glycosyltransferase involved in LPS biosynthesis